MQLKKEWNMSEIVLKSDTNIIRVSVSEIINSIFIHVILVAALKTKIPEKMQAAIDAGVKIVDYNYPQEAGSIS